MIYKYELNKSNKVLDENEKLYFSLLNKIRSNEESKIFFIKCHMEKFAKIFFDLSIILQEFYNVNIIYLLICFLFVIQRINSTLVSVKIDEDIKIFYEKFKTISDYNIEEGNFRFPKEEFINYDTYLK